jgi:hypothetical protein
VRERLEAGEPVTWRFTPGERRLIVSLPEELGGGTQEVEIRGEYTFVARRVEAPTAA